MRRKGRPVPGWSITAPALWKSAGAVCLDSRVGAHRVRQSVVLDATDVLVDGMFFDGSAVVWVDADDGEAVPLWLRVEGDGLVVHPVQAWSLWAVPGFTRPDGTELPAHVAVVVEDEDGGAAEIPVPMGQLEAILSFVNRPDR